MLPEKPGTQRLFDGDDLVDDHAYGRVLHNRFKPQIVCRPCNSTWMSQLESATKPILRPLMLGERMILDRRRQTTLATWACLKNMVAEFSHPASRATDETDLCRMYTSQLPPERAAVWIGQHEGDLWTTRYIHRGMRIVYGPVRPSDHPPLNGQATTFAVGRVIFHLLSLPEGLPYGPPIPQGPIAAGIHEIYPSTPPFAWPLGQTLSDADAFDLGDLMTKMFKDLVEKRR